VQPVSKIRAMEKYAFNRLFPIRNRKDDAEGCGDLFITRSLLEWVSVIRICVGSRGAVGVGTPPISAGRIAFAYRGQPLIFSKGFSRTSAGKLSIELMEEVELCRCSP
jgi:hypothetical protein